MRPTSPLRLALALALAHSARAALDLPRCQSRCYTMTAGLVGCGAEDYACHCAAFDARFAPQMSSCMIEGCAFDNETPLDTKKLKEKVCGLAGQSATDTAPRKGADDVFTLTGTRSPSDVAGDVFTLTGTRSPSDGPGDVFTLTGTRSLMTDGSGDVFTLTGTRAPQTDGGDDDLVTLTGTRSASETETSTTGDSSSTSPSSTTETSSSKTESPDETNTPDPADDDDDGDDDSGAGALSVGMAAMVPALGYFVL